MKNTFRLFLMLFISVAILYSPAYSQSNETGSIIGTATLESGEVVSGVTVKLSSPNLIGGDKTTITNERGSFRFVALPTGTYTLVATMTGFKSAKKSKVRLSVGTTLTVDFIMELGQIEMEVEVTGVPAMIDVKDSQTGVTKMNKEFFQALPIGKDVGGMIELAPGTYGGERAVAFGGTNNGVMFQLDGVKINNPEGGVLDTDVDFNTVEEVTVMGIGAPAEYDGFNGAIMNTVTKSGGNTFSGVVDFYGGLGDWVSDNSDNPDLLTTFRDSYQAHFSLGGPIKKDKIWFYSAMEYARSRGDIEDMVEKRTGKRLKLFGKLTWQMGSKDRISGYLQYLDSTSTNRDLNPWVSPEAASGEGRDQKTWNLSWLHIFSDYTFLEAKYSGFDWLIQDTPSVVSDNPMREDEITGMVTGNFFGPWDAYRKRNQVNVTVTHHADDFLGGSHDFKFGVEWERSPSRTYARPAGKDDEGNWAFYIDYDGDPFLKIVLTEYDVRPINKRLAAFAQDSWSIGEKLVVNAGVRFNQWRGELEGDPLNRGNVFSPELGIAPRIGITYDLFNNHSTALKAHYGKYYHGFINFIYSWMGERESEYEYVWGPVLEEWEELEPGEIGEVWVEDYSSTWNPYQYEMAKDIRMPYVNQFTIGVERELTEDLSIGVTYIYRSNHDLLDMVLTNGEYSTEQWTDNEGNDPTGETFTIWQYDSEPDDHVYRIYNPKKGDYDGLVAYTPYSKYRGLEFTIHKRYSNNWQLQASYVYGKAWGTSNNDHDSPGDNSFANSGAFSTRRNLQTNIDGRLFFDPTHMVKIQGSVLLPLDISLGMNFTYNSGMPYARNARTPYRRMNGRSLYLKTTETGEYKLPDIVNLDIRFEKIFKLKDIRLSVMADVTNIFNSGVTTDVIRSDWSEAERSFQTVDGIVSPRRFRVGLRVNW